MGGSSSVVVVVVLPGSQKLGVDEHLINRGGVSPLPLRHMFTSWLNDLGKETRRAWLGSLEGDLGSCSSFTGDAFEFGRGDFASNAINGHFDIIG